MTNELETEIKAFIESEVIRCVDIIKRKYTDRDYYDCKSYITGLAKIGGMIYGHDFERKIIDDYMTGIRA